MLHSMTGFGRSEVNIGDSVVSIEIKTLNSKYFDAHFRLPTELKLKEIEIRQLLSKKLGRGKVECMIMLGGAGGSEAGKLNNIVLHRYLSELKEFMDQEEIFVEDKDLLPGLLRLPDVFGADEDFWKDHWADILEGIEQASDLVNEFRQREGKVIQEDLEARVAAIQEAQANIEPFEEERITRIRTKLQDQFEQAKLDNKDRFEQEMIYYLERLDVSEEKSRLTEHCSHFLEVLNDNETAKGKRMNFVSQEMGREINTLGSKANHAGIQRLVILMKDELEKIKEQNLNCL